VKKSWKDECGVFGIWNAPDASRLTYLGLYAIQHRGQESAGIVSLRGQEHYHHKGLGLVGDVFTEDVLAKLPGDAAIGHNRYSTTGLNFLNNAQPITANLLSGPVAIAHNGNIVNAEPLRQELKSTGAIFQGTNDTEVLMHLIARHPSTNLLDCLKSILARIEGAYSLAVLSHKALFAIRDPWGFRPLVLGEMTNANGGTSFVVASESCAFDLIGAKLVREIEPGEIFWVDETGTHSVFMDRKEKPARCVFEHVYFARPDSVVFGRSVYETRKEAGKILAREYPANVDLIIPVPDSGVPAAIGYANESGVQFDLGIIRNHYIGRTFIQPHQSIRDFGVKIKLNPQSAILKGKRVVVVDDSLVRGTTCKKIIALVRAAGATEVHLRIAAPPTTGPCYYGVDTPEKSQLIAATHSMKQIQDFVGADSLGYLSVDGLHRAVNATNGGYCAACFDGKYPTALYGLDRPRI
jgi:amidophosphoribosyltransferase